jgi:hypothetical protein
MATTSKEMEDKRDMLSNHALVVKEVGSLGLCSCEELKDLIAHQFGFRKQEFFVYRSCHAPFVIIFSDQHARDVVFAAGRAIEGPVEVSFSAWELDEFSERAMIPFRVRLNLEGMPQHAWSQEMVDRILCDEAFVHHVEESTRKRVDFRAFCCWAFSKDPSRIPQVVFLTLSSFEADARRDAQIHFVRPRGMKHSHIFKILIHIDVVEDLSFYHFPREELLADDRVPWREFAWYPGCPDGEVEEEEFNPPPSFCGPNSESRWRPDGDEDRDRNHKRGRSRGSMHKVSSWIDNRGRSRNRVEDGRRGGWFVGESSRGRRLSGRDSSPPHARDTPPDERRAMQKLWQEKGNAPEVTQLPVQQESFSWTTPSAEYRNTSLDIIEITPVTIPEVPEDIHRGIPEVITIIPHQEILQEPHNDAHISSPLQTEVESLYSPMENRREAEMIHKEVPGADSATPEALQPAPDKEQDLHGHTDNEAAVLACSGSPQQIDQAIQQQGKELHELLQLFRQTNTEPLASCILQTPKNKDNTIQMKPKKKSIAETATKSIQRFCG